MKIPKMLKDRNYGTAMIIHTLFIPKDLCSTKASVCQFLKDSGIPEIDINVVYKDNPGMPKEKRIILDNESVYNRWKCCVNKKVRNLGRGAFINQEMMDKEIYADIIDVDDLMKFILQGKIYEKMELPDRLSLCRLIKSINKKIEYYYDLDTGFKDNIFREYMKKREIELFQLDLPYYINEFKEYLFNLLIEKATPEDTAMISELDKKMNDILGEKILKQIEEKE